MQHYELGKLTAIKVHFAFVVTFFACAFDFIGFAYPLDVFDLWLGALGRGFDYREARFGDRFFDGCGDFFGAVA